MAEKKATKKGKEDFKKKFEELKDDHLRLRAEFENFRKRTEKEKIEIRERAVGDFVLDLLPAIDNFEMSLKMTDNKDMFIKGVEMIHKNLLDTLKDNHIEPFEGTHKEDFDPSKHEPIPIEHEGESGKVLESVRKGYKHKEKVLRPARVHVKKED